MKKYYIVEAEKPVGPFSVQDLLARGLRGSDLVWAEGMPAWVAAENVEEIRMALYSSQSVPPCAPAPGAPSMCQPQQPPYGIPPVPGQQPYGNKTGYGYNQPQSQGYQQSYYSGIPNQGYDVPPKNWLVESILVTLFCCLPFGIVGIVKASGVSNLWNSGRTDEARQASADAKKWTVIGFWCGLGINLLSLIYYVAVFAGAIAGSLD